ncbi:MAG: O-antigen ligase family protein [Candidatus Omnitrophica bacterium]|nr:O-antigen ligase family protein [Candidatus Omnitrophota bacterium]MDD5352371.1 O-antigen ligase family protein [Candidatus Omnitrophota bacterium]MDD5549969.1 O-antigen ligase family protein [Candidatus Omnitrophota bacterium]
MNFFKKYGIESKTDAVDFIILSILWMSFLAYSIGYKAFAEIHIKLPFLNFPIFIGEIILFVCILLTIYKWILIKKKFSGFHIILIFYLFFVLLKAFWGYLGVPKFNALAFRHAAMFYYPLFALIAYEAYQNKFNNPHILLIPLFLILNFIGISTYYKFTYLILMFLYVFIVRNNLLRVLGLLFIVLSRSDCMPIFIKLFSHCPRTQIIGNIAGFTFLFLTIIMILKIKRIHKIGILVLCMIIFIFSIIKLSYHRGGMRFLIYPTSIISSINEWERNIKDRGGEYHKEEIPIKLYSPETKETLPQFNFQFAKIATEKHAELEEIKITLSQKEYKEIREIIKNIEFKGGAIQLYESQKQIPKTSPGQKIIPSSIEELISSKVAEPSSESQKPISETSPGLKTTQEIISSSAITIERAIEKKEPQQKEVIILIPKKSRFRKTIINYLADLTIKKGDTTKYLTVGLSTITYRFLTWRDMIKELISKKAIFGFNFGKPLRSESIEISRMAYGEWTRDGWIAAHNSYLELIYRSGIIGIILIIYLFITLFKMIKRFVNSKSLIGILLVSIIIYWLTVAFVYVTFEMPYSAIFFWSLFGITLAYSNRIKTDINK